MSYAGDVMPQDAWEMLSNDPAAVLIDVRTQAEWAYVGIPDLSGLGKQPLFLPWQVFPSMQVNPEFIQQLASVGLPPDTPMLFLCRSGVRSRSAAKAMTAAGYSRAYNVAHGFEGDPDSRKHRGRVNGWKMDGLPWVQS
ncbi:MAG: rhodanese-like domain-containing protein [Hyphomicrobiales bacterium]|nr:rhodanese-like domain-containing protein [Hyphomicrobiales bacterium]